MFPACRSNTQQEKPTTCSYNRLLTLIAITPLGLHWLHYNIAWAPSLFAIINSFVFFSPSQQIINLDYRLQKD